MAEMASKQMKRITNSTLILITRYDSTNIETAKYHTMKRNYKVVFVCLKQIKYI